MRGLAIGSAILIAGGVICFAGIRHSRTAPTPVRTADRAPDLRKVPAKPTYAEHIAPILNAHCVECHQPGAVAPFSLIGYQEARRRSGTAVEAIKSKIMPPWKAVQGFGDFRDENRLTPEQVATIERWQQQGMPSGDLAKAPNTPAANAGWTLGKPDLVLEPSKPYSLGPEGSDEYVNFVIPTNYTDTKWVTAIDVRPGNNRVVHHVIAFLDAKGSTKRLAQREGGEWYRSFGGIGTIPSGSLGGWAPGLKAQFTPAGTGLRLEPGSTVVLQIHYHRTGKVETDKTKLGLYFSKVPVTSEMHLAWYLDPRVNIPAGENNYRIVQRHVTQRDTTFYSVMPHMHLLGRTMTATAALPGGKVIPLIKIDDWDFNWQLSYCFKQPIRLPKGTTITIEATYDNSAENVRNPNDPPQRVRFGEQTNDEMFLMIAGYTVDGEPTSAGPFNQFMRFP